MKRMLALCVVVAMMVPGLALAVPAPDKLPAGALAVAELASPTALDGKIGTLAKIFDKQSEPSLAADLPMMLKTGDPASVDMSKPVQFVVCEPLGPDGMVIVFSVTDAKRYLDSVQGTKTGEKDGVILYQEKSPWGQPGEAGPTVAIAVVGSRVALGMNEATVGKIASAMKEGAFGATPLFAGADAGAVVNLDGLLGAMKAQMNGQDPFMMIRMMMMQALSQQPGGAAAFQMQAMDGFIDVVKQLQGAGIEVNLGSDAITLNVLGKAKPGSDVAKYLAGITPGQPGVLKQLPAGKSALIAAKTGDLTGFAKWYGAIVQGAMASSGNAEQAQKVGNLLNKAVACLGGETGASYALDADGMHALSVTTVKDAAAAKALINEAMGMMPSLMQMDPKTGIKMNTQYKADYATYKGVAIGQLTMDVEAAPQTAGGTQEAEVAAILKQVFDMLLGPDKASYSGIVGNSLISAEGKGGIDAVKAAIDGTPTPAQGSAQLAAGMKGMPADAPIVGYVVMEDVFSAFFRIGAKIASQHGEKLPPELFTMQMKPGEPLGFAAWTKADTAEARVRMPITVLTNLRDAVKSVEDAEKARSQSSSSAATPSQGSAY